MFDGSNARKYDHLSQMSTEDLEELLRADMASEEDTDPDLFLRVMEVIEEKEKGIIDNKDNTDRAWREFQELFNTPEGVGQALYPASAPNSSKVSSTTDTAAAPRRHTRHSLRRIAMIAAAAIIVLGFMIPTALGYESFYQMIGQWTQELFQFQGSSDTPQKPGDIAPVTSEKKPSGEYASLQEALIDHGIPASSVPSEVPDGFELQSVRVSEYPDSGEKDFFAYYLKNDSEDWPLIIAVTQYNDPHTCKYEKGEIPVEEYVSNGITYYFFANEEQMTAAWYTDYLEGSIYGNVSADDLKMMVATIE